MKVRGYGATSVGMKRDSNEDALYLNDELQLYVVSDGMGGGLSGEVASSTAVSAVVRVFEEHRQALADSRGDESGDAHEAVRVALQAFEAASREVFELAQSSPECARAGCTLTVLVLHGNKAAMAHVGDSRLYLCRGGRVHQLSTDHTMAAEMVQGGILTPDKMRNTPYANTLTRAIGMQRAVPVDTVTFDVLPGDRFLMCSDGLSNYVGDDDWLAERVTAGTRQQAADGLIEYANASGGSDNVTVLVIDVEGDPSTDDGRLLSSTVDLRQAALTSTFLFRDLPLVDLSILMEVASFVTAEEGEVLVEAGATTDKLYVVMSGLLELAWYDRVLAELTHGDYVGAATLVRPRPSRATLTAARKSLLIVFDQHTFRNLVWSHPKLGVTILERLAWKISEELDSVVEYRRPREGHFDRF